MSHVHPTLVTTLRLLLALVAAFFINIGGGSNLLVAFFLNFSGEMADIIDGQLARKYKKITEFGKFFDPLCDCLSHLTNFGVFVAQGWMPGWMFYTIMARETLVYGMRYDLYRRRKGIMAARKSGKVKSISQAIALCTVVFIHALAALGVDISGLAPDRLAWCLLFGATMVTAYTLYDYGTAWWQARNQPARARAVEPAAA